MLLRRATLFIAMAFFLVGAENSNQKDISSSYSPKLSFGGLVGFEGAYINQTINTPENIRKVHMGLGALFLNAAAVGEAENGLIYSLNARFFADGNKTFVNPVTLLDSSLKDKITGNKIMQGVNLVDRLWIELKGKKWGTLHIGNYPGANDLMIEDSSSVMGGNGGMIFGNWSYYANIPYGVVTSYRQIGDPRSSTKISYYTTRFGQLLQLGVSYSPRSDVFGLGKYTQKPLSGDTASEHVWGGGVNISKEISGVNVKIGASGVTSKSIDKEGVSDDLSDVITWEAAAHVTTGPIDFAVGYLQNGTSLLKNADVKNGKNAGSFYDAAISYTLGSLKLALGGMWSVSSLEKNDAGNNFPAKLNAYSLTADYKLFNGLTAYVDVTKFNGETDETLSQSDTKNKSNDGYVGFIGLNISF